MESVASLVGMALGSLLPAVIIFLPLALISHRITESVLRQSVFVVGVGFLLIYFVYSLMDFTWSNILVTFADLAFVCLVDELRFLRRLRRDEKGESL